MNQSEAQATASAATSSPLLSTSKLSGFAILKKLGQGAQGVVFKVRRIQDNQIYVLKQISVSNMQSKQRKDSQNEAVLLHQLNSPYIVRYFDSFVENRQLNIVMEYCEQGDLETFIKNQMGRPLPESRIWRYFFQIAEGLLELHSKNILHRDIKSMNIFLTSNDSIRIGDLGVAKRLESTSAHARNLVGTPYYMSPEILQDIPYNDKSDVWSLGCVLYQLITFRKPFEASTMVSLAIQIQKAHYMPIPSSYSVTLHKLIEYCLTKDHIKRKSVAELLEDPEMQAKSRQVGHVMIPKAATSTQINISPVKQKQLESPVKERHYRISSSTKKKSRDAPSQPPPHTDHSIPDFSPPHSSNQIRQNDNSGSLKFKEVQAGMLERRKGEQRFDQLIPLVKEPSGGSKLGSASPYIHFPSQGQQQGGDFHREVVKRVPMLLPGQMKSALPPPTHPSSSTNTAAAAADHASNNLHLRVSPMQPFNHMKSTKSQINYGIESPISKVLTKRQGSLPRNDSSDRQSPIKINRVISRCNTIEQQGKQQTQQQQSTAVNNDQFVYPFVRQAASSLHNVSLQSQFQRGMRPNICGTDLQGRNKIQASLLDSMFAKKPLPSGAGKYMTSSVPTSSNISFTNDLSEVDMMQHQTAQTTAVAQQTNNPQLKKLFKNKFEFQVQMQSLTKICVAALGQSLFREALAVFRRLSKSDQEITKLEHENILFTIEEILMNKLDYSKHFYQIVQLESQLAETLEQITRIESE